MLFGRCALPAMGTFGGILMAWNPSVITKKNVRLGALSIPIILEDNSLGVQWLHLTVYGTPIVKK